MLPIIMIGRSVHRCRFLFLRCVKFIWNRIDRLEERLIILFSGIVNVLVAWSQWFPLSGRILDVDRFMGLSDTSGNLFITVMFF